MSRRWADTDEFESQNWTEWRLCEGRGCGELVHLSRPSVFCAQCEADAAYRLAQQRQRELEERRRAS